MEEVEFLETATGANPVGCVIWMHGLGADATDFEPIVPLLPLEADLRSGETDHSERRYGDAGLVRH